MGDRLANDGERCPYLSSIKRSVLDFDYEKICSVTLREEHIYCCLVCGINYQGKGKDSVAYKHSLELGHHLFINLTNSSIICLPNDYEIYEHSLEDIKKYLQPRFNSDIISSSLYNVSRTFDGIEFFPGFIGLSNFGNNDSLNSIILILSQITEFRDLCLSYQLYDREIEKRIPDPLLFNIIESIQKIYNPHNLKGKFSPYNLAKIIERKSNGKFSFSKVSNISTPSNSFIQSNISTQKSVIIDPMALFSWIIYNLKKKIDKYLGKFQVKFIPDVEKNANNTHMNIINACIKGKLYNKSSKYPNNNFSEPNKNKLMRSKKSSELKLTESICFNCLSLTLPSIIETTMGISNSAQSNEDKTVLQIPIYQLLDSKFFSSSSSSQLISKLPCYLFIHISRFSKTNLNLEKNKTLVSFPLIDLDLSPYIHPDSISLNPCTKYNLIANISHKGSIQNGKFLTQLLHPARNEWIEIEDINVKIVLPQAILLNETYILTYKRSDLI
ncbi:assembly defective 1 like ubiquitin C-terminal hydrolase with a UBP finger at the N-terminus [Cryptosporidium sp. chipmunk genotype I]|uniref:assembly defective 1 like ubiquitin C-terminal hydrolase with a UBP finger at the N-terminus n=1 Tax=Cryptosporidium sp. chipmunk genotype I TaxID=1280935 RepID=UPI00351A1B37|nr:assembly defective 1 like ubiquitin C-terminal hydrolase with a UBP finger at the N-terminus [Cryptosporidium sp. chipmunk genotype I]